MYKRQPQSYTYCWDRSGHGLLNVTEAITNSCNYFFATMGYRMGMDTLVEYLKAFGLGSHTGIEIGDSTGTLPENPPGEDQAPWAAFGQSSQAYTPLQLANYIATLVSGGEDVYKRQGPPFVNFFKISGIFLAAGTVLWYTVR